MFLINSIKSHVRIRERDLLFPREFARPPYSFLSLSYSRRNYTIVLVSKIIVDSSREQECCTNLRNNAISKEAKLRWEKEKEGERGMRRMKKRWIWKMIPISTMYARNIARRMVARMRLTRCIASRKVKFPRLHKSCNTSIQRGVII